MRHPRSNPQHNRQDCNRPGGLALGPRPGEFIYICIDERPAVAVSAKQFSWKPDGPETDTTTHSCMFATSGLSRVEICFRTTFSGMSGHLGLGMSQQQRMRRLQRQATLLVSFPSAELFMSAMSCKEIWVLFQACRVAT